MNIRLSVVFAIMLAAMSARVPSLEASRQEKTDHATMPGRSIYDDTCSRCHGPNGQDGKAPTLVPFRWTYAQAIDIIRHGGTCGMPAFSESDLSDEDVKQIVDYLKT